MRRELRQHPAQLALGRALEVAVSQRLVRPTKQRLPRRIDSRQPLRVGAREQHDPYVRALEVLNAYGIHPLELLVVAVAKQRVHHPLQGDAKLRTAARTHDAAEHLADERRCANRRLDQDDVPVTHVCRVADEHVRKLRVVGIRHSTALCSRARGRTFRHARSARRPHTPRRSRAGRRRGPSEVPTHYARRGA